MYLRSREELEREEEGRLARYAVRSRESRGREHAEAEHRWRTCFQRDRDRVIHTAAFRRLEAKTQVFFQRAKDYYRTRLTHTIEVSQIARTMARGLGANEDLAEAAALAHDLGHPPYGHSGEAVLNELMAGHGGFEHNAQSLRIVEYLEHPYPAFRGLNLCYETRECLAKHESRYDRGAEREEFSAGHGPLEGQIADLADEIAYTSHDLDDGLAAGLIGPEDLGGLELIEEMQQITGRLYPEAAEYALQLRTAKGLIDLLIVDAWEETARRLGQYKPTSVEEIRVAGRKIAAVSDKRARQLAQLGELLMERVYLHPIVKQAGEQAQRELSYLFERYLREPQRMPERYQRRQEEQGGERVVCDYLAGMTDRYCQQVYKEFRG